MAVLLLLLLVALFAKDVLPLGDRFILRGVSEGAALLVGLVWMIQSGTGAILKRYAVVVGYLGILFLTIVVARQPEFVGLQWMTLFGVALFFIAYAETRDPLEARRNSRFIKTTIFLLTLSCAASLFLLYLTPESVYEREDQMILSLRFRGVYGKSGQIASASGLLLGLSLFFHWFWWLRLAAVSVALPCLYLSATRGAWVAAVVGVMFAGLRYRKHRMAWTAAFSLMGVLTILFLAAGDIRISQETRDNMLRGESLQNLSGRLMVWEFAMKKFLDRPWLGYGFTAGADALDENSAQTVIGAAPHGLGTMSMLEKKSYSLHNGYIQALLDSGAVGACFYLGIVGLAMWRLLRHDRDRRYTAEFYALLFLLAFNLSHSLILGASTMDSVFYWYLAIFALSLSGPHAQTASVPERAGVLGGLRSVASSSGVPRTQTLRFPLVASKH
jgi:O-antigen ligase